MISDMISDPLLVLQQISSEDLISEATKELEILEQKNILVRHLYTLSIIATYEEAHNNFMLQYKNYN